MHLRGHSRIPRPRARRWYHLAGTTTDIVLTRLRRVRVSLGGVRLILNFPVPRRVEGMIREYQRLGRTQRFR